MMGHKVAMNPRTFSDDNVAIAYGMGHHRRKKWRKSGTSAAKNQDQFALRSHQKAHCRDRWRRVHRDSSGHGSPAGYRTRAPARFARPRPWSIPMKDRAAIPIWKPWANCATVFDAKGTGVTAATSSQMSDGAGALILVSERVVKELNLKPVGRVSWFFSVAGVPPEIMGIGPIEAIPKVLKQTGYQHG